MCARAQRSPHDVSHDRLRRIFWHSPAPVTQLDRRMGEIQSICPNINLYDHQTHHRMRPLPRVSIKNLTIPIVSSAWYPGFAHRRTSLLVVKEGSSSKQGSRKSIFATVHQPLFREILRTRQGNGSLGPASPRTSSCVVRIWRCEVVADETAFRGAQLAIDTTLVSAL